MDDLDSKPIILITGATGYIGRRLTHHLLHQNRYGVRLFVRNQRKIQAAIVDSVEIYEGSTFEPDTLTPALKDVDTAYYLIHSMGSRGDFEGRDRRAAEREAAEKKKTERKELPYAELAPYNTVIVELEESPGIRFVGNLVAEPGGDVDRPVGVLGELGCVEVAECAGGVCPR